MAGFVRLRALVPGEYVINIYTRVKYGENPVDVPIGTIAGDYNVKENIALGVKNNYLEALLNGQGNPLTYEDIMNLTLEGDLVGSVEVTNASETTITFANDEGRDYTPTVSIEDNINTWVEVIGPTSFKVHFSAPYTGKVWYAINFV